MLTFLKNFTLNIIKYYQYIVNKTIIRGQFSLSLVDLVTHLNGFILVAHGHLQLINELVMFLGGPSLTVFKSLNNKKIHIILKSLNFLHFNT